MTPITIENLEANGWKKIGDAVYLMEKSIENRNPLNSTPEDTDIKLIIHRLYNSEQMAIVFPYGEKLNFNVSSMEELKAFENAIDFYDCPY